MRFVKLYSKILWIFKVADEHVDFSIVGATDPRRARASEFFVVQKRKVDMQFLKLNSKILWLFKEADGRVDFSIVGATDPRRARARRSFVLSTIEESVCSSTN